MQGFIITYHNLKNIYLLYTVYNVILNMLEKVKENPVKTSEQLQIVAALFFALK